MLVDAPRVLGKGEWPPDYVKVFAWRQAQLLSIMQSPKLMYGALEFYADNPVEFITHWVDTFDPRLAYAGELPTRLPLVLFERQADLVNFVIACLEDQANGLIDKSRDTGATWVACAISVWLWRFKSGASVGWGSRKEQLVDKLGDPDSIFEKIRIIIRNLPRFFLPRGFSFDDHATYMRLLNPETGATITGEAGDNIGRGGRKLIYFKDESAHYEHPESIEAALGDNTNVQIDISTPHGVGTIYDRKKEAGREWNPGEQIERGITRVFTLDWSDHPAKTPEWHAQREKSARDNGLLHVFRQEVDRDPAASLQGIIIKPEWVKAAVNAHIDLKFGELGGWCGGFDPYDEGGDLHAFALRQGVVLKVCDDWGDGDTGEATRHVIAEWCTGRSGPVAIQYDCIGVGAGVKSEANRLAKDSKLPRGVTFHPWDAGMPPLHPKVRLLPGDSNTPTNEDFFVNVKAQGWWALARRFEKVHRMRTEGIKFRTEELISLDKNIPKLRQLMRELSQPVMVKSTDLRLKVDKKPEGARSPNMADGIMMNYFPIKIPLNLSNDVMARFGAR